MGVLVADAPQEFSFTIACSDFDKSLLPAHARMPGTDEFRAEVTKVLERDFQSFGGWAQIVVDQSVVRVTWRPDPKKPDPIEVAVERLKAGDYLGAVVMLEALRRVRPDDPAVLYNLGMALSDMKQLDRATSVLGRLVEIEPGNVNGLVALGVAFARQNRIDDAIGTLQKAVKAGPDNPWAQRNLGACLLKSGRSKEAESHLRQAVNTAPTDQQALYGLAQALEANGEEAEADEHYIRIIDVDSRSPIADLAKEARSRLAQRSMREKVGGGPNPAAVMYLLGIIQKFEKMSHEEIQKIAFEVAILGQRGLDTNDPAQKYQIKSLPGRYSGLHMVCIMYAGFKRIAPEQSVGFDLSKEYAAAVAMHNEED